MTKKEVREVGLERGRNVASWCEIPEIGQDVNISFQGFNWIGIETIEDENDQIQVMEMWCYEAESMSRSYTPFEFTAKAINEMPESEELWDIFDDAINEGISEKLIEMMQ